MTPLPAPRSQYRGADQAREMGLQVGDVIVGRETYLSGSWSESELTLLWLGERTAVWHERRRNTIHPEWFDAGDSANWNLAHRQWYKVLESNNAA